MRATKLVRYFGVFVIALRVLGGDLQEVRELAPLIPGAAMLVWPYFAALAISVLSLVLTWTGNPKVQASASVAFLAMESVLLGMRVFLRSSL